MKRNLITLLVMFLATITLSAQSRMSYSLEFVAGVGVGKGPQVIFIPEFVAQYDLGGSLRIGAGVGTRFARPCLQYITRDGSKSRTFCKEWDIPVFMRLGYGKEKLYANLDAGYAIGALCYYDTGWIPGGKKEPSYSGFFVEPQVGWRIGGRSAFALGLLFQQSTVSNFATSKVTMLNVFTPAVTLRYVLGF